MDKNLMNIDDLFRQRLGGGEEREQAGSWGRMSELLDKEMPQRPAGMYWRRTLSAVALLLLVAGVSVGGYEMASYKRTLKGAGGDIAAASINNIGGTANAPVAATTTSAGNATDNNDQSSTGNENKNIHTTGTTANVIKSSDANGTTATAMTGKKAHNSHNVTATAKHADKKAVKTATAVNSNTTSTGSKDGQLANNETAVKSTTTATNNKEAVAVAKTGDKKNAHKDGNTTGSKQHMDALALAGTTNGTPGTEMQSGTTKTTGKHKKAAHDKLVLNSGAPAMNGTTGADEATDETTNNENAAITENTTGKKQAAKHVAAVTNNGTTKKTAGKHNTIVVPPVSTGANAVAGNIANNNTKLPAAKSTRKAQRQVQQLVVTQRYISTSPTQGKYRLDTVSMETVTEEYDQAIADASVVPYGPMTYEAMLIHDNGMVTTVTKDNSHVKKTTGTSSMESLHAAFNDMKDKVKGAHFGAGLTAGVNGTFFGPNSFKGFQFGVTGSMSLNESVSVMGELKYFHRINNNYVLNDNYYSYTPSAGGYTKELVQNPYGISTLHSIELPISVRYCTGNFNFFVGGNFEYSFAINTGAYPLPDPTTTTQVTTVGTDNAGKLKNDDFNSRLGFGYLVGASYQVTPNVMIDFRNVQNIWDNGNTAGAKMISSQLYKSPSLQLSVGYKLGGKKERNK